MGFVFYFCKNYKVYDEMSSTVGSAPVNSGGRGFKSHFIFIFLRVLT